MQGVKEGLLATMDPSCETFILLVCLTMLIRASSASDIPPPPDNLMVNIWDGEVTLLWDAPRNAPPEARYNVQFTKYDEEWADVGDCTRIQETYCEVTRLVDSYTSRYKVKVQLVTEQGVSPWTNVKRFLPNKSQLFPPSFTLLATSSTLTVKVHRRPILMKVFPYGLTYTIHLEERRQSNKTTVEVAYLKDDVLEEAKGAKTFHSLHWGTEYCVSLRVEGNGALFTSKPSPDQCIFLPEQEWFVIAVSSLTLLGVIGVLTILLAVVFYFLRRPEKMPVALTSPTSGWSPLTVAEGPVEVVTDKGWFLLTVSESRANNKTRAPEEETPPRVTRTEETTEEEEEGGRTDSGVSVKSIRAAESEERGGGAVARRRDDSGCGSLGESPRRDRRTDAGDGEKKREEEEEEEDDDSGTGLSLSCRLGDGYRGQSPLKRILAEPRTPPPPPLLADVVTGYRRSGHSPWLCVCSGAGGGEAGRCVWCRAAATTGREDDQIVAAGEKAKAAFFPGYRRKTHVLMETVVSVDESETHTSPTRTAGADLGGVFSRLTAALSTTLPPVAAVTHCSPSSFFSLTLSDVEVRTD